MDDKWLLIVPISQCSDVELKEKAVTYRAMASGCSLHAAEIERYIADRKRAV